jgi:hypothetical protein
MHAGWSVVGPLVPETLDRSTFGPPLRRPAQTADAPTNPRNQKAEPASLRRRPNVQVHAPESGAAFSCFALPSAAAASAIVSASRPLVVERVPSVTTAASSDGGSPLSTICKPTEASAAPASSGLAAVSALASPIPNAWYHYLDALQSCPRELSRPSQTFAGF